MVLPDNTTPAGQAGFTVIEVMVAVLILLVGVLGTLGLVQQGLASTKTTTAREQGVNVARELVERTRQVAYTAMSASGAPAQLRAAMPDAGPLSGSAFTVLRRGVTYTVTVTACSIDDPSDGVGFGDATFCAAKTGTSGPGGGPPSFAGAVNVLGVTVAAGGSLLQTVCNAVGTNPSLLSAVTASAGKSAPVSVCPSGGTGSVAFDSRPDDLRQVLVNVTWTRENRAQSLNQTTVLANSLPNNCPATTPVLPATLPTGCPAPIS